MRGRGENGLGTDRCRSLLAVHGVAGKANLKRHRGRDPRRVRGEPQGNLSEENFCDGRMPAGLEQPWGRGGQGSSPEVSVLTEFLDLQPGVAWVLVGSADSQAPPQTSQRDSAFYLLRSPRPFCARWSLRSAESGSPGTRMTAASIFSVTGQRRDGPCGLEAASGTACGEPRVGAG